MINFNFKNKILYKLFGMMIVFFIILSVNVVSNAARVNNYSENGYFRGWYDTSAPYITQISGDEKGWYTDEQHGTIWNHLKSNSGKLINVNVNLLNPNHYVFCVENGRSDYKFQAYTIGEEQIITDHYLSYILASHKDIENDKVCSVCEWNWDNYSDFYKHGCLRQNLIWRFLERNKSVLNIPTRTQHSWPTDGKTLNDTDTQKAWDEMKNYVKRQEDFGIHIKSLTKKNDSTIKLEVSGIYDSYEVFIQKKDGSWVSIKNNCKDTTVDIEKEKFGFALNEDATYKVRVKACIKTYRASIIILKSMTHQDFLIRNPYEVTRYTEREASVYEERSDIDISLQKYIISVNDEYFEYKYNDLYDIYSDGVINQYDGFYLLQIAGDLVRDIYPSINECIEANIDENIINKLKACDFDEDGVIDQADAGKFLINLTNSQIDGFALSTREDLYYNHIENENRIPYYNQSLKKLKDANFVIYKNQIPVSICPGDTVTYRIKVYNNGKDDVNGYTIIDTLPQNVDLEKVYINNEEGTQNEVQYEYYPESRELTIVGNIAAFSNPIVYDVVVKFKNDTITGMYENKVKLECVGNNTQYRTEDYDFVIIQKKYQVSLEKFVSKVNGKEIEYKFDGSEDIIGDNNDRSNRRYTEGENPNTWKKDNPVVVNVGEVVHFSVILCNTGRFPIKISEIEDKYSANLKYIGNASILGRQDITVNLEGDMFKFSKSLELKSGEHKELLIPFEVTGDADCLNLENEAKITKIFDINEKEVEDSDGPKNNIDKDFLKLNIPRDISLQKFITKVNDKDVNGRENGIFENSDDAKKNPNKDINFTEFNKGNNPVNIIDGDIVTYKIKVYNNTAYTHENIKIKDTLSYEGSYEITSVNKKIFSKDRIMEDTVEDITANFKINEDCTYTIEIIPAGGSAEFEISIKYNDFTEGKYENKVEFVDNNITTGYRIVDKDFVIMQKKYQVSLEKFICQVNGNDLVSDSNMLSYNCNTIKRKEKVIYGDNEDKNIKENDPVQLEVGDTVTYKIILKNTGEDPKYYGEIMNLIVEDNCPDGLKFSSLSGSNITNSNNRIFTYTEILDIKETTEFYITYEVLSTAQDKDIIENTATVSTQLQDKKKNNRIDSDGEWNNTDKDWIKIKPYKISLEKYVSKVNGRDYANRSGLAEYLTYDAASDYYIDKTETASKWARTCTFKYNHPVNVYNGDEVEYNIKVKNDGKTKIKIQYVKDNLPESGIKTNAGKEITLNNADFELMPGESRTFTTKVEINEPNISTLLITNHAYVTGFKNKNKFEVKDKTPYNNKDNDYVQLGGQRFISLSIEKVWVIPEGSEVVKPSEVQMQLYRNGQVVADGLVKLNDSNNWKFLWANLYEKDEYGNDYTYDVKEVNVPAGFKESYTRDGNRIICTNTAGGGGGSPKEISVNVEKEWHVPTGIKIPDNIKVQLYQNGVKFTDNDKNKGQVTLYKGNNWKHTWNKLDKFDENGKEISYTVSEVSKLPEYDVDIDIKREGNNITYKIINRYYINNPDIIIGGYVWNDKAFDKTENDYNAKMNKKELKLNGIKVYLYRSGVANAIAETVTNSSGYYGFSNSDIKKDVISQTHKQYIKAEMCPGTKRWSNNYYSYYVVFEYDGITYTSAFVGDTRIQNVFYDDNYKIDSNACEDNKLPEGEIANLGLVSREKFNENIDANRSKISYYTVNKRGYIPQSIHVVYELIKSSTNKIDLSNLKDKNKDDQLKIEDQLKYVSLGLRGRDLFDLELTSEVNKVNIIVNGQEGEYDYNGSVKLRKADLEASTTEDMANVKLENSNTYCSRLDQRIRASDINPTDVYPSNPEIVDGNAKKYASEQAVQEVYVTYKITVHNTSNTNGKPTAITNYFDKNYEFIEAKASNGTILNDSVNTNPGLYNSVTINTSEMKMLSQGDTMDIYIKYKLTNSGIAELLNISEGNPLPTYNMAEITSYVTACSKNQTEYTRGLIDKDSAPNSVDKEEARTTGNEDNNLPTIGGSPTTVDYYFGGVNLNILKYEDDTFATPVLYFVYDDSTDRRTIRGTVFEDSISVDNNTKIKKGNGKKDDDEKVIYGATVKLIEVNKDNSIKEPSFITTTDEAGKFVFENVLPGYYILEYHYGDTENTVVIDKNSKSYNGEDFQATNNENLNTTDDFWYIYNEKDGYSTAKDNLDRRKAVSKNVFNFEETYMEALKKVRVAENLDTSVLTDLIKNTQMYAKTKKMLITVEKSSVDNGTIVQSRTYGKYIISNMNFGIAEVPITKVELKKRVLNFVITDSTGQNIIAKAKKDSDGVWKVEEGEVIGFDNFADISIEDQKLQGARLEVRYEISINLYVEKNFDNNNITKRTIAGLADFIDNNLSYNAKLDDNDKNWKVATYDEIQQKFKSNYSDDDLRINRLVNYGTVDQLGNKYSTIVMAKEDNPLLSATESAKVTLTLEKILSSTDSTLEDIINSAIEPFVYNNTVEITVYDYSNTIIDNVFQDKTRVRVDNADNSEISIPGIRFDKASSDRITIHPPTGDSSISTTYYIVAVISLAVLAIGIYGIKKFVIKK